MIRTHLGALAAAAVLGAASSLLAAASAAERGFAAPQQAADALLAAAKSDDAAAIERVLGPGSKRLVESGDLVADKADRAAFAEAYDAGHTLVTNGRSSVLHVGASLVTFPIPLVETKAGWHFDTAAGAQYVLDRRVGRNELDAIETCRAIVDAEREYAEDDPAGSGSSEYAQHFLSKPGKKDGLYWPAGAGPESPLGPLVAEARAQGYGGKHAPYHGYFYKLLTKQGLHAPGGARDYVVKGHMIGGFAVVAYPARWGDSGVMSFIADADGSVLEKNLGRGTAREAARLTRYDPDDGWRPVAAATP